MSRQTTLGKHDYYLAREQPEAAEALYRTAPELAVREGIIFPKKPLRRFDGPAVQIAPR